MAVLTTVLIGGSAGLLAGYLVSRGRGANRQPPRGQMGMRPNIREMRQQVDRLVERQEELSQRLTRTEIRLDEPL